MKKHGRETVVPKWKVMKLQGSRQMSFQRAADAKARGDKGFHLHAFTFCQTRPPLEFPKLPPGSHKYSRNATEMTGVFVHYPIARDGMFFVRARKIWKLKRKLFCSQLIFIIFEITTTINNRVKKITKRLMRDGSYLIKRFWIRILSI